MLRICCLPSKSRLKGPVAWETLPLFPKASSSRPRAAAAHASPHLTLRVVTAFPLGCDTSRSGAALLLPDEPAYPDAKDLALAGGRQRLHTAPGRPGRGRLSLLGTGGCWDGVLSKIPFGSSELESWRLLPETQSLVECVTSYCMYLTRAQHSMTRPWEGACGKGAPCCGGLRGAE